MHLRRQQPARRPATRSARQRKIPLSRPNFNEADVSDKPQSIQNLTLMNPTQQAVVRARYRAQSVAAR